MSDELTPSSDFFTDIRSILADARRAAYTAVNSAMVAAYWQIGRRIVEEEQGGEAKANYGDGLLKELSRALTAEFGKGFSLANLKNFRKFYLTFPDREKSYTLCSFLTWSHNHLIMREKDPKARLYYLQQAKAQNWSVRQLQRQIETRSYQRLLAFPINNQQSSIGNQLSSIHPPHPPRNLSRHSRKATPDVSKALDPRHSNGEKDLLDLSGKSFLPPKDLAFHPDAEGVEWRWRKQVA